MRRRDRHLRRARPRRPAGHHDTRREPPEDRREMGPRRGHRAEHEEPDRGREGARVQEARAVDGATSRARTSTTARSSRIDYQTGELVAYVGSADYYATSQRKPEFQPQYDVLGKGYRQPGSAFKPFNYAVGINDRTITAGDDADGRRHRLRGQLHAERRRPPRARTGAGRNALQFSLNIPAVKTMAINTPDHVFAKAQDFGMVFQGDADRRAGPRARRPGGPSSRPGDRLRHPGQPRQVRSAIRRS